MSEYKNIFCASNPARLTDALWQVLANVGANNYLPLQKIEIERNIDFSNDIIFLPSRRAVRSTEKMLAEKSGGAVMLPRLVALGEEADDDEFAEDEFTDGKDIVSNLECAIVLAKMLDAAEGLGLPTALVVAKDLVRMMDYLENERKGQSADIDWVKLVGEQYAGHFQKKAKFLNLAAGLMPAIFPDKITNSQKRNADIRGWIDYLGKQGTGKVIVCGSTGSVPATADLMEYVSGLENGYIILPGAIPLLRMGGREAAGEGLPVTNPYYSELKFCDRIKVGACDVRAIEIGESAIGFFNAAFGNIVSSRRAALAASAGSGGFERDTNNSHSSDKIPHSDAMPTPREQSSRGDPGARPLRDDINFTRIDCARESEEAEVVAEITATAVSENKSVLIITPDAAGNQRLRESFARRGIVADFSGGTSGAMAPLGRAILNRFDAEIKNSIRLRPPSLRSGMTTPRQEFKMPVKDLFGLINDFNLEFSESDLPIIEKIKEASDILLRNKMELNLNDARAVVAEALSSVQIRPAMRDDCNVSVLGTIESRMQTADVVILTGLNEGMFPANGYENPWLPRHVAGTIGLPPPERKISLMAMDFINLSCGGSQIYWTRSRTSGGMQTTESRFLSRVSVTANVGANNYLPLQNGDQWIDKVRAHDAVPFAPLDNSAPRPIAVRDDVYVTELELLIHNPYAFYARHILRLRHNPDPWEDTKAVDFGNLVHEVIEDVTRDAQDEGISRHASRVTHHDIINLLDRKAKEVLEPNSVLFHFWHRRFTEMAPVIVEYLNESTGADIAWAAAEDTAQGEMEIASRRIRAKADKVYIRDAKRETRDAKSEQQEKYVNKYNETQDTDSYHASRVTHHGVVIDIKTGKIPNEKQLNEGMMPQLPLEAFMLQHRHFVGQSILPARVVMKFLQLARGKCRLVEYDADSTNLKIEASVQKISELFGQYSKDYEPYEYRETSDIKYKAYDDLARRE